MGYSGPASAGSPTNQLSLTSMILGIAGLVASPCCSFLAFPIGVGAVATGIIGLTQVNADPQQAGKGQAIAGIVCGALAMVLPILFIVLSFGFSSFSSYE